MALTREQVEAIVTIGEKTGYDDLVEVARDWSKKDAEIRRKDEQIQRMRKELEWIRDHVLWGNADITCIKVHDRAILALFEASRTYAEDGEVDGETE